MSGENIVLKSKIGSPAFGDDEFFGREDELNSLIEKLIHGNNVYISAPRRIGKTSLMRRAEKVLEDNGNICFFHDLEGFSSPSEWIYELAMNMYKHTDFKKSIWVPIKNFLGAEKLSASEVIKSVVNSDQWSKQGRNFFKALYDSCPEEKRIVIFLDELAVLIQTMQEKHPNELLNFLKWFRSIRQDFNAKVSFVIASSIGLHPLLERLKLNSDINDLTNFRLDAWKSETAKECILALARGKKIEISPETAERMTEIIGWCSPYYVQAFFDSAYDHLFSNKRDSYSREELSEIYFAHLIRGNNISPTLNHMVERLAKSLTAQEFDLAKQILNKLAQNDEITAKSEVKNTKDQVNEDAVRYVLKILKHDGYIEELKDGYRFLSNILRDWWRNEYGD